MILSPLEIEILLSAYYSAGEYDTRGGTAQAEAIQRFLDEDMIQEYDVGCLMNGRRYHTTERGHAMVKKLCSVPLPVKVCEWV